MLQREREGERKGKKRGREREGGELVGAVSPLLTNQRQNMKKRKPKTIE